MGENNGPVHTAVDSEDNPKAVFFGSVEEIITPLALYLSERHVDLFSANVLKDAFFGNYFFYVGLASGVEEFVEKEGKNLPKTLLLLDNTSDFFSLKTLIENSDQLKIAALNFKLPLTPSEVHLIFEFFFASYEKILTLTTQKSTSVTETTAPRIGEQAPPELAADDSLLTYEDRTSGQIEKGKEEPVAVEIPAQPEVISRSNELQTQLKSLFNRAEPKPTGQRRSVRIRAGALIAAMGVLFLIVVFPLLLLTAELGLGTLELYQAKKSLARKNLTSLEQNLKGAQFFYSAAQKHIGTTEPVFQLVRQQKVYRQIAQMAQVGRGFSEGSLYLVRAAKDGEILVKGITGRVKTLSFGQLISAIKGNLTLADTELGMVEAELKTESFRKFLETAGFSFLELRYKEWGSLIGEVRQAVLAARNAMALLPETTGIYGQRTYLVVFQNNMELRPTGGFIGSYGVLKFDNGLLTEFTIEDIYTADGALKGHIDPPEPIRVFLGQEHWYMRDSNWSPDFSESGARIAWFLDKEIDMSVDGVIAVDLYFAQSLLEVVGPVELVDYKKSVSADNLFTEAHKEVETDFFPGSTQKRDFLGALGRALIDKILEDQQGTALVLTQKFHQALKERHALLYMIDPTTQGLVKNFDWGGTLEQPPGCKPPSCTPDYLLIADANLGVNKVNYFVKRTILDKVNIDEDLIRHTLTITYKNSASGQTPQSGIYKNYFRVYTTADTTLVATTRDSLPLTIDEASGASSSSIAVTTEGKFHVFGAVVEVPPQSERTVVLTYQKPLAQDLDLLSTYTHKVQKQPGTLSDELQVNISYPASWEITAAASNEGDVAGVTSLVNHDAITYNSLLSQDQLLKLTVRR